ncbi:MAG: hypothetical protein ACRENP_12500 [Longimicrobiales bacterium]
MSGPPPIRGDIPGPCVVYCSDFHIVQAMRSTDAGARVTSQWLEFAQLYPTMEAAVVASGVVEENELPDRLVELGRRYPLPTLIVATHLDAPHLVPFRRVAVDEFVSLEALTTSLPVLVNRIVLLNGREHLARHVEQLQRAGHALRTVLARALRMPTSVRTIQGLADELGVSARTLENQWKTFHDGRGRDRLEDLLWVIRLIHVLELRVGGTQLDQICRAFNVDARSLRRASRRILGRPLGALSVEEAVAQVSGLRQRLTAEWPAMKPMADVKPAATTRSMESAPRRSRERRTRI